MFNRRVYRLDQLSHNNHSLENYYDIKNTHNHKLKITHIRSEINKLELHIYFENYRRYDFANLPEELSLIICEYIPTVIFIRVEICFPNDYPYKPPIYSMINIDHNVSNPPINLEDYYKYIIDNHNEQYKHYWTPVLLIEKDILDFIRKVNHFEYLL